METIAALFVATGVVMWLGVIVLCAVMWIKGRK